MSRAASWLLLVAVLTGAGALASGFLLQAGFRALLDEGAGAVEGFQSSSAAKAHALLGYAAAAACVPAAASAFLLALHGLLAPGGPKVRAACIGLVSPLLMAGVLGAVLTGHARWEPTRMGELQPEELLGFLRVHGLFYGGAVAGALILQVLLLVWVRRGERRFEDDDEP